MDKMILPCQDLVSGGTSAGPAITWSTARACILVLRIAPDVTVMGKKPPVDISSQQDRMRSRRAIRTNIFFAVCLDSEYHTIYQIIVGHDVTTIRSAPRIPPLHKTITI